MTSTSITDSAAGTRAARARTTPAEATAAVTPGSHLADPAPLGLGAFALTTMVLSVVNAGWIDAEPVVFGLAFAYGGAAQFAAGMWEFAKGNTFGATAFTSYGAFWLSFWWLTGHTDLSKLSAAQTAAGIGLYLAAWAVFTLYMTVGAAKVNKALLTVFVLLTITFAALAIGEFSGSAVISHLGGYLGIATALAAWYASFAGVLSFTHKRAVLPVGAAHK